MVVALDAYKESALRVCPDGVSSEHWEETLRQWSYPDPLKAREWYDDVAAPSQYAAGIEFRTTYKGATGCILAVSTVESMTVYEENVGHNAAGIVIHWPAWLYYDFYWFESKVPMNMYGCHRPMHALGPTEGRQRMKFGKLLEATCQQLGMHDWRHTYCRITDGDVRMGLRRLLRACGIGIVYEYTACFSYHEYRCLDLYVNVTTAVDGMVPPAEEAWFILGMDKGVDERDIPSAVHWWWYDQWKSNGQRPIVSLNARINMRKLMQYARTPSGMHRLITSGMILSLVHDPFYHVDMYGNLMWELDDV